MASPQFPMVMGTEAVRDISDQLLLERFIAHGDETAFVGLVGRYSRSVWGVCRRLLNQEQDAEDAFQAVFLVLARKAASIRKGEALGSWLYGVAYRTAMKARYMASRRAAGEKQATVAKPEPTPPSEAAWRELQRQLDEELQRLAERHRAPFILCCLEGMSRAEAARELGWKEGTVSSRLAQARKLLQTRLARRGVTISAVLTAANLFQNTASAAAPSVLIQTSVGAALTPQTSSVAATALADSVIGTMAAAKVKTVLAVVVALMMFAGGVGWAAVHLGAVAPSEVLPKFTDVNLAGGMPGVTDTGFHEPENFDGQTCRWTNGTAHLVVPLRGEKPRTLALSAVIPDRPGYRVRIAVNGKTLFDDEVWTGRVIMSFELPLADIDLGDSARIDVDSSTCVPTKEMPNNKDDRTLGIRLTRLILQTGPATSPTPGKKYAREYTYSLAGNLDNNPEWKVYGPVAKQCVRPTPAGLRLKLPLGFQGERRETGLSTGIRVQGDFDVTTRFEILQEPQPADTGAQTRFLLTLWLDRPPKDKPFNNRVAITRQVAPSRGTRFQTWLLLWNEKLSNLEVRELGFPTTIKSGRLRIVRSGSLVSYYVADGAEGDFRLLHESPIGREDVRDVRIGGVTGGPLAALDVRFSDLHIRADALPKRPSGGGRTDVAESEPPAPATKAPAPPPTSPVVQTPRPDVAPPEAPRSSVGRGWLPVGLLLGLALMLAVTTFACVALYLRWRRPSVGNERKSATAIAIQCPACGRNVLVKSELAGKKVKCAQCGKPIPVPAPESTGIENGGSSAKTRAFALVGVACVGLVLVLVGSLILWFRTGSRSFLDLTVGNRFVVGVQESGFYQDEENAEGPFRWTAGNARLVIPIDPKAPPQALLVQLHWPKDRTLQIKVNDRELANEKAATKEHPAWEKTFDLAGIDLGRELVLDIVSSANVPKITNPNQGHDDRPLGVKVRGVKLLGRRGGDDTPPVLPSFMDVTVGNRKVPGIEDSGFYQDELGSNRPTRWTNGKGKLIIPLAEKERPQAMLVQLGVPKNRSLRITVNERELVNEKATEQTPWVWEKMLDLTGIEFAGKAVIEILSDTSVPKNDSRMIGVTVRGIRLLSTPEKFTGVDLAGGQIPRVVDEGFYSQERFNGKPCRWTNGSARLTVPIRGETPRTLALSVWIPGVPHKYRIRVAINGKPLFDGAVASNSLWSRELPLTGVNLGDTAHIQLDSSAFVPAEVEPNNKDSRKLGVRLTRLMLLAD